MKGTSVIGTMAAAAMLALTACSGGADDSGGGADDSGATNTGFEGCDQDPNACNGADRADGGDITWVVMARPGSWNLYAPEGGTIYGVQTLHGIYPYTGQWQPDGETYEYNMDLLSEEPQLLSEDPFTYQFKIRDEAVWDDGTPIDIDDWLVSWKFGTSEGEGHCIGCRSRESGKFDTIESVEGSDDGKTITVTLKDGESDPEWFGAFSAHSIGGGLVPAHLAEAQGFDVEDPLELGEYFEWMNSTVPEFSGGPYRIVEGDLENQVIKEPNDNWYGEIKPTLDTVVIRFLTDQGAWVPALQNEEIHGAAPLQVNEDIIRSVQEMPGIGVHIGPGPSWERLDFNLDVPEFDDVALRKAIFTAVDTDDIANRNFGAVFEDYTLRTNYIFPESSPYHVDLLEGTGYGTGETDAALAILEEAGYEFDGETLSLDGEQIGPFRLSTTPDPARITSVELIQSYLAEIGIEIIIEPNDQLGQALADQDFDIIQYGWSGTPFFTRTPLQIWGTGSRSNFGNYSNPRVDELVSAANSGVSTLDEAAEATNEASQIIADDAYVLPMYDTPVYIFANQKYVNVRDHPTSTHRALYNHHEWGLAAE